MFDVKDIAEKLRLKEVIDQSSITIPPQNSVGDLPTIFSQMLSSSNSKSLSFIEKREACLCAILSAMSRVTYYSTLNDFVKYFLDDYLSLMSSVEGKRSKQLASICGANVQYERKLEFARIKNKEKEDFV